MTFILKISLIFTVGVLLGAWGCPETVSTAFIFVATVATCETHKPDQEILSLFSWAKGNLKWICLPLLLYVTR